MAGICSKYTWEIQNYFDQKRKYWPKAGKHILAQFDEDTIIVYQAYNPEIANYAVEHQKFGGENFSFARMSWIKTNFLWMMYRCGWASKKNQERVLAVRITRDGFEEIISKAMTGEFQKSHHANHAHGPERLEVRLQWDPDHSPTYGKLTRRAIQLGLKGEILRKYGTEWVVEIKDVTDFVKEQHSILQEKGCGEILTARERVYTVQNPDTVARIQVDDFNLQENGIEEPEKGQDETFS